MKSDYVNVLIADDDELRTKSLSELIRNWGISAKVAAANTVVEARRCLAGASFDMIIIDLVLPIADPKQPHRTGGLVLLEFLESDSSLFTPRYVVGITSFTDVAAEQREEFSRRTWSVVEYDQGGVAWQDQIRLLLQHVLQSKKRGEPENFLTDVLLLTALRNPEHKAVLGLPWNWEKTLHPLGEHNFSRTGRIRRSNGDLTVVSAYAAKMGLVWTTLLAQHAIAKFRPRLVLMSGMCMGVPDETNLGDIIVATASWNWQAGKFAVTEDGSSEFQIQPEPVGAPTWLGNLWHEFPESALKELHAAFLGPRPDDIPRVRVSPMVSGSAVIADETVHADVLKQDRKLRGVDMETFGLYAACAAAGAPRPAFVSVKAVSDFGRKEKADDFQEYCSYMSAQAAAKFIDFFWPHIAAKLKS